MRLSAKTETYDELDVLAGRRRELPLVIETDRPMRKRSHGMSKGAFGCLRAEVLQQIDSQMRRQRRRSFRGRVAVDLKLRLPEGRYGAELGPIVKGYLDVLIGSVYGNDAVIDHLTVSSSYAPGRAVARIRCRPLRLFAASFDRSFRVAPELAFPEEDADRDPAERPPWGLRGFDHHDAQAVGYQEGVLEELRRIDAEEDAAFEEDQDAGFVPETSEQEFEDPVLRGSLGRELEQEIGIWRGIELTDQGFDARDRPGGEPRWLDEVVADDRGVVARLSPTHPGTFLLSAPLKKKRSSPEEANWDGTLREELRAVRRSSPKWRCALFREDIVLDIAAQGGAGSHLDLDNLARRVRGAFLEVFPSLDPISGYRVYRVDEGASAVRVRVLPAVRLELFRDAWDLAEEMVLEERAQRSRGLSAVG